MINYCPPTGTPTRPRRNTWGVDLNRNYRVGSLLRRLLRRVDRAAPATPSPARPSSPSRRPTTRSGSPTRSRTSSSRSTSTPTAATSCGRRARTRPTGREPLPGAEHRHREVLLRGRARRSSSAIKDYRGTVILPGRTGPIADVLYSAAGNSADEQWYNRRASSAGLRDRRRPRSTRPPSRSSAVGFQPPFAEGHEEAMEFASGLIGMLEVADAFTGRRQGARVEARGDRPGTDTAPPRSPSRHEPANVYYTLDGSRPTLNSPKLVSAGCVRVRSRSRSTRTPR